MASIWTLTLNPCVDQISWVQRVEPDKKLRTDTPRYDPGGGGINVARAIHKLGGRAEAVYLAGGLTGELLSQLLDTEGIGQRRVPIEGMTRQNVNVFERSTDHLYRFIMPGPSLSEQDLTRCEKLLDDALVEGDYLVLSGSLPPLAPRGTYAKLAQLAQQRGARVIADTSGKELHETLAQGVYLIKPNLRELRDLVGEALETEAQVRAAAEQLVQRGYAQVALVSLGTAGALLVTAEQTEHLISPTVTIRSRIGAGDSMVGGLTWSLARGWDIADAVRFGIAAGAAAVMTPGTELCRREDAEYLYTQIQRTAPAGGSPG